MCGSAPANRRPRPTSLTVVTSSSILFATTAKQLVAGRFLVTFTCLEHFTPPLRPITAPLAFSVISRFVMAFRRPVFTSGQRVDKKVPVILQRTAPRYNYTHQESTRNSELAPSPPNTGHSTCQCKSPACRHVTSGTASAKTSDSGARRGSYQHHECWEEVKVFDVSRSTFNEIGHDQYNFHNCCINFVVYHHHNYFHSRWTLEGPDLKMNMQVASDDCNPTAIVTTTVFRTTNVSVVAPFFANLGIDFSSEVEEDLILTVERTSVRYTFFSDPK